MMILNDLKDQTRLLHETLDGSPRLRALFSQELTLAAYVELLEAFRSVYEPLERGLGEFFACHDVTGLDFEERRKLPLLERDLEVLNGRKAWSGKVCTAFSSAPAAMGCLYVLEGATLGGQVIARAVRRRLGIEGGLAFFSSYQNDVAEKWRTFRDLVGNMHLDQAQQTEMIESAKKTFAIFIAHLGQPHAS